MSACDFRELRHLSGCLRCEQTVPNGDRPSCLALAELAADHLLDDFRRRFIVLWSSPRTAATKANTLVICQADDAITRRLRKSLSRGDVRVLDHRVVAAGGGVSFLPIVD